MANDTFPGQTAGADDSRAFRNYGGGGLGPDAQRTMIGGTYNVSTPVNPEQALRAAGPPIPGDSMPAGAPVDPGTYTQPYTPGN